LPVGWVLGLVGFYYLKTPELQSPGRYVLPLLPAEVMVLALLWAGMETRLASWKRPLTAIFLSMHAVFALAINFRFVTPVLRRFEGEYGDTMRAAAEELAARTEANANRDVLVEEDIGVLGYSGRGRFEISDGGALATPSLRGLSFPEQLSRVHPALVVQSLASNPDGLAAEYPGLLTPVWKRRFRQHGVGGNTPYYYAIIFRPSQPAPAP
ncbi:MAG TPA: hypothetical protein VKT78_18680, partial [Fimbriimonadaceae bacterium]|nr:hypothetical protein [Fimbriimonadaceae bacterium]